MAEEIDDNGFYREDFTTESPWEVFNAQLGEIFQDWDLSNAADWGRPLQRSEIFSCKWDILQEKIHLLKREFVVSYHRAVIAPVDDEHKDSPAEVGKLLPPICEDLMSLENTFGPMINDLHPLARFYGLRRFVLVYPSQNYLNNPSEFSFFLSSASIAAAETNSAVPIFVSVFDPKWNYFVGVHVAPSSRINFDVVALETAPPTCKFLSGLLTIFKEKLSDTYIQPAKVSVRNTYVMDNIMPSRLGIGMRVPFSKCDSSADEASCSQWRGGTYFVALPCGYFNNSTTELTLYSTWPEIAENIAIDSELRTVFAPSKAHNSSMALVAHVTSYLSSALNDFTKLSGCVLTLESFVGRNFSGAVSGAEINPLEKLTRTKMPQIMSHRQSRKATSTATTSPQKKLPGPIYENELMQMLYYIFPDLQADPLFPYTKNQQKEDFDSFRIKSALPDSLVLRLSCLLTTCHAHFGGKNGMAQLWAAFTRELRFLLDNFIKVPGIAPGFPDTRTCLLHQKLQMLNICMERREIREWGSRPDAPKQVVCEDAGDDEDEDDDGDDEFYDCSSDEGQPVADADGVVKPLHRPEGRRFRLGDLKLIDSKEPLYVPVTQDPVPKTEDQLLNDAEVMLKLGPGSGLSTQMMCTSLLSDMEAFKAANPHGKIEDFIRWYSPRDWEETIDGEDGTVTGGRLSARMLAPDNTWQTIWKQAQAVPAWRQKRLFDDTNEALKVLHYLETRTIGEIFELTVVPVLHSAVLKLKDIIADFDLSDILSKPIDEILSVLGKLSRDVEIMRQNEGIIASADVEPALQPILSKIQNVESQLFQYKSLESLFNGDKESVKDLFGGIVENDGECNVRNKNLTADTLWLDHLVSKEYVIRVDGETTSNRGHTGPQFLRAIVTGDRIRLCGAFSENTTFV